MRFFFTKTYLYNIFHVIKFCTLRFLLKEWFPVPPVLFSPVVEPEHQDAFLTISPEEAYETGVVSKKPYIFGLTKDEGKSMIISKHTFSESLRIITFVNLQHFPHIFQFYYPL